MLIIVKLFSFVFFKYLLIFFTLYTLLGKNKGIGNWKKVLEIRVSFFFVKFLYEGFLYWNVILVVFMLFSFSNCLDFLLRIIFSHFKIFYLPQYLKIEIWYQFLWLISLLICRNLGGVFLGLYLVTSTNTI